MTISRAVPGGWGTGDTLAAADLNQVDTNTTYALDKRTGQTDTLRSTVTLTGSGAGILLQGAGANAGRIIVNSADASIEADVPGAEIIASGNGARIAATANGATVEASAAGAKIRTMTGGRIECSDNDYPLLGSGHTGRTVARQLGLATWGSVSDQSDASFTSVILRPFGASSDYSLGVYGSSFDVVNTASSTLSRMAVFDLGPYVRDGGTITSAAVTLTGYTGHATVPARMPRIAVYRVTGTTLSLLHAGTSFVDSSANTTVYQSAHAVTATCTTNNVVDKTQYRYALAVWNEGGSNSLTYLSISNATVTQTITDLRPA